jgi:hypothetical protein
MFYGCMIYTWWIFNALEYSACGKKDNWCNLIELSVVVKNQLECFMDACVWPACLGLYLHQWYDKYVADPDRKPKKIEKP